MTHHDALVIGGGSTGCSVLFHLAKAGAKSPILLDAAPQLAAGQTSRSTAIVRTHYSTEVLARMALLSYRFFRDFDRLVPGRTAGYVETGLIVGADEASVIPLRKNHQMHRGLGIDSRLMAPNELAASRLEPMLDASAFSLFSYEPNSGYAEPSTTATSFASAALDLGAKVLTGTRATSIAKLPSGGYEVSTTAGPITSRSVVIATGVWSRPLFAGMGIRLPVVISRHPVAVFGRPPEYRGRRPVLFDFPRSAYYKPEGNELLFVGTLAEVRAAREPDPDSYEQGITHEEAAGLSESAASALPTMATSGTYRRGYAGLYDNTPDEHPVIDELSAWGYPGVYCVVGLSGHGFKLAPEFGRIVATMMTEGTFRDYDVSPLRLKRFEEGRLLGGRYGVSTIS